MWMACLNVRPSHDVVYRERGTRPKECILSRADRTRVLVVSGRSSWNMVMILMVYFDGSMFMYQLRSLFKARLCTHTLVV